MRFVINGRITVGYTTMWRIDDLENGLTGLDFMQNPFALVPKREDAETIVNLLNKDNFDATTR